MDKGNGDSTLGGAGALTHERCSELLRGYARGELPRDVAEGVRAHLAGCEECRAEQHAVAVLAAGPEAGPMDDLERARLHRGLAQELFATRANADVAGVAPPSQPWTRWIAPVAAAAAVVAAVVVMTTQGGSDDAAQLGVRAPAEGGDAGGSVEDSTRDGGGEGGKSGEGRSRALSATTEQGPAPHAAPRPLPEFDPDAGSLTTADLSAIGRSGDLFGSFADAYAPTDGPLLYDEYLGILTKKAGGIEAEIEECAATLPQDGTVIPVYGALGEYDDTDVLVLGFVTSDPGSDELDRYLMWVWERGNCRQPIDTLFEELD